MNKTIEEIFKNFKVNNQKIPVTFLRYEGKAETYVVYSEVDKIENYSADDELCAYKVYYDFDIYSKTNYLDILDKIKEIMLENNFYYDISGDEEEYEVDTKYYHKILSFYYLVQIK